MVSLSHELDPIWIMYTTCQITASSESLHVTDQQFMIKRQKGDHVCGVWNDHLSIGMDTSVNCDANK